MDLRAPATVVLVIVALLLPAPARADGGDSRWAWPLVPTPHVERQFQPPSSPYGPGHRGVDLLGAVGRPVYAVADGIVRFAGSVAGRGVVVVDHGRLTSTYQPVLASVRTGVRVSAGDRIGTLEAVHSHCLPAACLHLGAKQGDAYIDPLPLLGDLPIRLKPLAGLPTGSELAGSERGASQRSGSQPAGAVGGSVSGFVGQARGWAWRYALINRSVVTWV